MRNLWLLIQLPFWLLGKAWKWGITYPSIRSLGAHPVQAKHMTFCKKEDEEWTLSGFSILDDIHYGSEHSVKCSQCGYEHIAKRAWLRGDAWPGDLGSTFEEAKEKAKLCGPLT